MTDTASDNTLGLLAQGDAPVMEEVLAMNLDALQRSGLDPDTYLLVRIAALVAVGAPPASWAITLGAAAETGMTVQKAQAVLVAIAPIVGAPRVTAAAGTILGVMLDAAATADEPPAL